MNNWSDYPIFLAVAETGSLTAAGNQLGISQPTVGRRIKALEAHFGAPLLTKEDGHLCPTEFGYLVLDHIRRMESEADAITRSSATLEHSLVGPVMLAASQGIGDWWLPSVMQVFRRDNPDIIIDVNIDFRAANLAQREADIALRWMGPGTQNSLIGATRCQRGVWPICVRRIYRPQRHAHNTGTTLGSRLRTHGHWQRNLLALRYKWRKLCPPPAPPLTAIICLPTAMQSKKDTALV